MSSSELDIEALLANPVAVAFLTIGGVIFALYLLVIIPTLAFRRGRRRRPPPPAKTAPPPRPTGPVTVGGRIEAETGGSPRKRSETGEAQELRVKEGEAGERPAARRRARPEAPRPGKPLPAEAEGRRGHIAAHGPSSEAAAERRALRRRTFDVDDVLDLDAPSAPLVAAELSADCTAFAPSIVGREETFLIQTFLHPPGAFEAARALARDADPGANLRASQPLGPIGDGDPVEIRLDAPDLVCDEPVQSLTWRGRQTTAGFLARLRPGFAATDVFVRLRMVVAGAPYGSLAFGVKVVDQARRERAGGESRLARYRRAFLSYASEDRLPVLRHYQLLKRLGFEVFQDVMDIEPGARWEAELVARIGESDLFLLYWSRAALASDWVRREALIALGHRARSGDGRPDIVPILLEGPPPPAPPLELAAIHFNDPIRYVIAAVEWSEP